MPDSPVSIQRGQAEAFVLDTETGDRRILKKFRGDRRLDREYLTRVTRLLPVDPALRCGSERSILDGRDLDIRRGHYTSTELRDWIQDAVLMPVAPGTDWAALADDLREGILTLDAHQRISLCSDLSRIVGLLEKTHLSHRDLSSGNIFIDIRSLTVYLIDFDSAYHATLAMPPCTAAECREAPSLRDEMLRKRYLRKDEHGHVVETPEQMFERVANTAAEAETVYGVTKQQVRNLARLFYEMMQRGEFLPNSPALMNAGRRNGLLSACFILPVEDSIEGIFDAIKHTALIQKAGGGTGFAFDRLRPTGDLVASSGGKTSGPLSFMRAFSEATNAIQQGAFRRGANMAMMSIEHPDILRFIVAKARPEALENFNFSVKVPDSFMGRLRDEPSSLHVVTNPRTGLRYVIPKDIDLAEYVLQDLRPADKVDIPCYAMGHASIRTTEQYYLRLSDESEQAAAKRYGELLAGKTCVRLAYEGSQGPQSAAPANDPTSETTADQGLT